MDVQTVFKKARLSSANLVGFAAVVVLLFLPWYTVGASFLSFSLNGMTMANAAFIGLGGTLSLLVSLLAAAMAGYLVYQVYSNKTLGNNMVLLSYLAALVAAIVNVALVVIVFLGSSSASGDLSGLGELGASAGLQLWFFGFALVNVALLVVNGKKVMDQKTAVKGALSEASNKVKSAASSSTESKE